MTVISRPGLWVPRPRRVLPARQAWMSLVRSSGGALLRLGGTLSRNPDCCCGAEGCDCSCENLRVTISGIQSDCCFNGASSTSIEYTWNVDGVHIVPKVGDVLNFKSWQVDVPNGLTQTRWSQRPCGTGSIESQDQLDARILVRWTIAEDDEDNEYCCLEASVYRASTPPQYCFNAHIGLIHPHPASCPLPATLDNMIEDCNTFALPNCNGVFNNITPTIGFGGSMHIECDDGGGP